MCLLENDITQSELKTKQQGKVMRLEGVHQQKNRGLQNLLRFVNVGERAREIFMSGLSVTLKYNHIRFLTTVHYVRWGL